LIGDTEEEVVSPVPRRGKRKALSAELPRVEVILGQFMNDFDAREIGRQRFSLATPLGRRNNFLFSGFIDGLYDAFRFIEQGQLRRCRISRLLGLTSE
jgi:hypothetical protein